ncbi:hypothetical protein Tco_1241930 [Tanacetum coccineum]
MIRSLTAEPQMDEIKLSFAYGVWYLIGKLDDATLLKLLKSNRPGSEKNGSKMAHRVKKIMDRKWISRLCNLQNNGSESTGHTWKSDDDRKSDDDNTYGKVGNTEYQKEDASNVYLHRNAAALQVHNHIRFAHIPKFRSTVFFDGVTYISSKTFQQLKIAEMDASRIAYFAIRQKRKRFASLSYKTTRLVGLIPGFRSSLLFSGVNYQGDGCKSKKEAEQLVACAVISKLFSVTLCSQGHYSRGTLTIGPMESPRQGG